MGRIKLYIYLIIILFSSCTVFAQSQISGKITTTGAQVLQGASVVVKDNQGKIVAYTISDNKGEYKLTVVEGDLVLELNFLGYQKISVPITVNHSDKISKNFIMEPSHEELKEVVIERDQPVKLRGDTLVYDAKALGTGAEQVVEDLIKRIPGITILSDGTIKYGDTPIEKVMVDGDDFFNRGYTLLTKNMPSKPLDKVEVLRNYSRNKHLKGIEESNGVALNLTVQEKYKNIWFGNFDLGYGTEERYDVKSNVMNFGKKYKAFLTFNLNNAGFDNIGNVDGLLYGSTDMETTGSGYRAVRVMGLGGGVPMLDVNRSRFNNAKSATFSNIFPLGAKAKLKLVGFLGFDKINAYSNSYSVTDFGDTYFENQEDRSSLSDLNNGYLYAFLNYDLSSKQMFEVSSTYSFGEVTFSNNYTFNGISTLEKLETNDTYFDQKVTYTHKWNDRNVVLLKGRFLTDKLPQSYAINDYLLGDLFPYNDVSTVNNNSSSGKQYAGIEADFKLKSKKENLVEFTAGVSNNDDDLQAAFSLFADSGLIYPEGFQSNSSFNISDVYLKGGYSFYIGKVVVEADLNAHQFFNNFKSSTGSNVTQNPFFINPFVKASMSFTPENILSIYFDYNINNNSFLQVNDTYLLTTSRNFSKGLGYFNQLDNYKTGFDYTIKHYLNRYLFSFGLDYSKQNDVLAYKSELDKNTMLSSAFIMKGGDRVTLHSTSHFIVKKLKGVLELGIRFNKSVYYNQINNSGLRKNIRYGQVYELGWASNFKSPFNFNFSTEWSFSQVKSDNTFKNSSNYTLLDFIYVANKNLNFKLKNEYYNFGGSGDYNDYFFTDFEALYSFSKDKYSVGLNGRNLFNTKAFTIYSVSDIGYSTVSYRLLPRYIMATFKFRF